MVNVTPLLPVLAALDELTKEVRKNFPEIPDVVLVVGSSGKSKGGMKHGHFHAGQWDTSKGAPPDEVFFSGESLSRGAEATLGTLIHELAHAAAHAQEIRDTSNNGRYHNTRFKAIAERFGIELEQGGSLGWSVTTLPERTASLYAGGLDNLREAITTWRGGAQEAAQGVPKPKPTKPRFQLKCPECDEGIKVPKKFADEHRLRCADHDLEMEEFNE
jgi:hypothetical protein